ncbi:cystin-1 [Panthera uncia]|uniref:cystin-1 n=1 Tax=Panthera uncia TaxID=29064 RepID=UPI0020FFE244|nr:cystin-1 [Panthera uncia]
MGSGSSRSGRALRRLRGPDSRPAGPGGAASEGGTRPLVSATAAAAPEEAREAEAAEGAADPGPDPGPAAPPDGGDETLRLLDQLLAESAAWGPGEPAPRGPTRPRPAAGARSPVSVGGARGAVGAAPCPPQRPSRVLAPTRRRARGTLPPSASRVAHRLRVSECLRGLCRSRGLSFPDPRLPAPIVSLSASSGCWSHCLEFGVTVPGAAPKRWGGGG